MDKKTKIIRVATVPSSFSSFCSGLLRELTEEGYDMVAVSSANTKAGDTSTPSELERFARNEGVRCIAVEMERRMSPLRDLRSLWQMYRVMRRERPQMVHSITPKAGLMTMIAAWLARVPLRVHTFTGLVFPTSTGLTRRILMTTDRITCACATHIVPEGEGVKADLLNYGITRKPISVLGYGNIRGIDLEHFNPEPRTVEPGFGKPFTFVFIGRLVGDKGINELVEAFTAIADRRPGQVRLILVGRLESDLDPLKPETVAAIDRCPDIEAVGKQSDVRPFLNSADALVFPSYREGFPNVVIEAGAMGLPSIVTDINGSREIIIEGENGTIIPPRDTDALRTAMERFIDNPDLTARLAANARRLIASRFEQGYVRQCLKDFYRQILGEKSKG